MSKPWGGVGAWALEAERAEAEELELAAAAAAAAAAAPPDLFPSLKDAAASKPKKKKPVPISLSEFHVGPTPAASGSHRVGLTHDEMLRLPTGPKERSQEELESSRFGGGGFRSYGGGGGGDRSSGSGSRRPYGGGFDDEGRRGPPQSRASDLDLPSRADEVDNWASTKKPFPMESGPGRHDRQDRYGSLGGGGSSKADEVDNWASSKKPMAPMQAPSRYSGFGSGFRDSTGGGPASDSDRWVRGGGTGLHAPDNGERERERRRLVLDPPKVGAPGTEVAASEGRSRPSPFGVARPREEVLAEKGVDWRKIDTEIETKKSTSRPTSSQSSRPTSAHSSRPGSPGGEGGKPRPKINPFGDARPREVLLEEKGKDWRKIDSELEHRRVDRPETDEEKLLREEINHLKKELTKETEGNLNGDPAEHSAELITSLSEQISQREKNLERLIHDLDDKVRFGQKASSEMRPGSGAGRISDRPPSQSGMSEDSRNVEFMERPRSRGGLGDSWAKPMDDRRGFQGSRESSFFGSKNNDRPRRDGW